MVSCPCFSDSPVSSSPSQRTSVHPQDPCLHILESTLPPRAPVLPWSSAAEGRERARMCGFPSAGSKGCCGLCSAILEGPLGFEAQWGLQGEQEGAPADRLSPSCVWILPLAKALGLPSTACHLPLGRMPTGHTCPRTKALIVCTPSPAPRPPPLASQRLPEEGRTRFLLLVLTPL